MKFQSLVIAAALSFAGAAFAAPKNLGTVPVNRQVTHSVKHHVTRHAVRHHHHAMHRTAMKHHKGMRMAGHTQDRDYGSSVQTDVTNTSREGRMDQALQKFRNHS